MSYAYDQYLKQHKLNLTKGYEWLQYNIPELIINIEGSTLRDQFLNHDDSKKMKWDEYGPYDSYFYGETKSDYTEQRFMKAWLLHIHRNPHHWQYWVLNNDDPKEGEIVLEMPYHYIVEMICDWWSFSWTKGDLSEIFSWYKERKSYIKFHPSTRKTVELILYQMKEKLKGDHSNESI